MGMKLNGTFDNTSTNSRQVFVNGILAIDIPARMIPILRDNKGNHIDMHKFGYFPDFPHDQFL